MPRQCSVPRRRRACVNPWTRRLLISRNEDEPLPFSMDDGPGSRASAACLIAFLSFLSAPFKVDAYLLLRPAIMHHPFSRRLYARGIQRGNSPRFLSLSFLSIASQEPGERREKNRLPEHCGDACLVHSPSNISFFSTCQCVGGTAPLDTRRCASNRITDL